MEKVISHFEKHGKVFRDQLITVGDLLEFKDLKNMLRVQVKTVKSNRSGSLKSQEIEKASNFSI